MLRAPRPCCAGSRPQTAPRPASGISHTVGSRRGWLALPMSSTLAGNLTLLGSIANLIVVERARHTVKISFTEYLKVGVP